MALGDEVRIDKSTSQRSQVTGHLLIVMPKLNAKNCLSIVKKVEQLSGKKKSEINQAVNIRNIVQDNSEIPPLI